MYCVARWKSKSLLHYCTDLWFHTVTWRQQLLLSVQFIARSLIPFLRFLWTHVIHAFSKNSSNTCFMFRTCWHDFSLRFVEIFRNIWRQSERSHEYISLHIYIYTYICASIFIYIYISVSTSISIICLDVNIYIYIPLSLSQYILIHK